MLVNVSPDYLYWTDHVQPIEDRHAPYFIALPPSGMDAGEARKKVAGELTGDERVERIGELETYQSFWHPGVQRPVFKVYTTRSYHVPSVSDDVFRLGLYSAEHDIPYHERALTDLAAEGTWVFDSQGEEQTLTVTAYDIEMTEYGDKKHVPIDIIGYRQFDVSFISDKDLDSEDFMFQFTSFPEQLDGEVEQLVAHDEAEEVEQLLRICDVLQNTDIVTGHNIIGFDNLQIYERIMHLLQHCSTISGDEAKRFRSFLDGYARQDRSFHFGSPQQTAIFYPASFDTYQAARKFYSLDSYTLGSVASFLGVDIADRVELSPDEMALDDRTLRYNRQDVMEQAAITLYLLQQALPLSFTTGMPFELLLSSGATKMWDYMAMIRAARHKKLMPAICRAQSVAAGIRDLGDSKEEIADSARDSEPSKQVNRVAKYGEEMPDWVEYPFLLYDPEREDTGYHFPGGMTIKPNRDADSDYVPWYHVVVADVGAMYPTILKAVNAGADTVRLAREDETVDDWVWLKELPEAFHDLGFAIRPAEEEYTDKGYMVGVHIDEQPGLVNLAMTGILNFIGKIKRDMQRAEGEEQRRLKMMYQSLKGARNAGTHGILSAPRVSCRQFNLWGAALITTMGQYILNDTLNILNDRGARVVYGDTDGIYIGCSRSMSQELAAALDVPAPEENWIIPPSEALNAIRFCNRKWRDELAYKEFELEPEEHEAMIFVKHKNYLIFDVHDGSLRMTTKGNNFKGSDKPNIARIVLADIMADVLRENTSWTSEDEGRRNIKTSLKKQTHEHVEAMDIESFDLDAFTLVQSVQPPGRYKPNPDGSMSVYGERAKALQRLVGSITARQKFKFVVTKKSLPGVKNPTKSSVKPIHYMYPVKLLDSRRQLDMDWYTDMIKSYVRGAFGLRDLDLKEQYGLDAWM